MCALGKLNGNWNTGIAAQFLHTMETAAKTQSGWISNKGMNTEPHNKVSLHEYLIEYPYIHFYAYMYSEVKWHELGYTMPI